MAEPPPWVDLPPEDEFVAPASTNRRPELPVEAAPAAAGPAQQSSEMPAGTPQDERWYRLVMEMCERELIAALVRELAMQSQCTAIDESVDPPAWTLRVERETLASDGGRTKLAAAMAEVLGRRIKLAIEIAAAADTPAKREAAKRALRQRQAEEAIRNDPLVISLMQQFGTARIVPGSVKPL
jgi:DNA polymerase-3 subunit gamma/tau